MLIRYLAEWARPAGGHRERSRLIGLTSLAFVVPVLFALAVPSLFPSARGHSSGPGLAAALGLAALAFILLQFSSTAFHVARTRCSRNRFIPPSDT